VKTAKNVIQVDHYTSRDLKKASTENKSIALPLHRLLCYEILPLLIIRLFYDAGSTVKYMRRPLDIEDRCEG
jgi:hypothetical protein